MNVEPGQGTEEVVGLVSKSWRGSSARTVSGGVEGPTVESSGSGSMWLSFMMVVVLVEVWVKSVGLESNEGGKFSSQWAFG